MRIVFMGTPDFAVQSLKRLIEEGCNVVGVVTMPDKAIGRHHDVLQSSPVKKFALEKGIPVLQPEKLRDETFLTELKALKPDLQIVVAFRMLPEVVWALPPLGTFNLHAALLPQYRGAAPINWAIINGDKETGITTFFLDEQIDVGVISPYRAQVQYLRKLIRKREFFKPYRKLISVNTVDGFQGQERDIILISLVRANEEGQIGFLRDLRRMNVAITRARMKLIILGDVSTLTKHPFYRKLYDYVQELKH